MRAQEYRYRWHNIYVRNRCTNERVRARLHEYIVYLRLCVYLNAGGGEIFLIFFSICAAVHLWHINLARISSPLPARALEQHASNNYTVARQFENEFFFIFVAMQAQPAYDESSTISFH